MKPMQVVEERGFIDKPEVVTKTEKWLLNDCCVPHEVMAWQDDNLAGERSDTNNADRTWGYDDDGRRNKLPTARTNDDWMAAASYKAPGGKSSADRMTHSNVGLQP
jgi:hypothetical protein